MPHEQMAKEAEYFHLQDQFHERLKLTGERRAKVIEILQDMMYVGLTRQTHAISEALVEIEQAYLNLPND